MGISARHKPKLATGAVLAACLALSLGDALVKRYSEILPLWQILLLRSAIAIPFLVYIVRLGGCETPLRPARADQTLLRSLALASAIAMYLAALPQLPLLTAAAAGATLSLHAMVFEAWSRRVRIGARGWLALGAGLAGMLLLLQPQSPAFEPRALLPLGAALVAAAATAPWRGRCVSERPSVLALWLNVACFAIALLALGTIFVTQPGPAQVSLNPFLLQRWAPIWLAEWRLVALLALLFTVAAIGLPAARRHCPAPPVAVLSLAYVPLAGLWGFALLGERPAPMALIGTVLLVGAGLSTGWRREP